MSANLAKISRKAGRYCQCRGGWRTESFTDLNFNDIGDYVPIPAKQYESRSLMAGLNFKVHKTVQISPNVKYVFYDGNGAPEGDFYFNLTVLISFNTKIGGKKK